MFDCGIIVKKSGIKRADIILLLLALLVSIALFVIIRLRSAEGSYAAVFYGNDAGPVMELSLERSEPLYVLLTYNESGVDFREFSYEEWQNFTVPDTEYNVLLCSDGEIRMLESSCPDKICVKHGAISMSAENIICLPHKLVIRINGEGYNAADGVAY